MRSIIISVVTVLLTGGLLSVARAPLGLAGEPPAQSPPSIGAGGNTDTAAGAQEPAAPATVPTMPDEPAPPTEAGDIQERGVLPGVVAPNTILQRPELQVTAPTPSLTAIRNAIRVTSKSISVNLRIPPSLAVKVPIEVSVAYSSSAQAQRQTKTYNPITGLTMLYHEAEGDGKPRSMTLDITVVERVPNGKSFSDHKQFTITPLYQATISPLRFNMATQCDIVGKSDITLRWIDFNGTRGEQKFDLGFGETKMVNLFASSRREFSMEANLKEPVMQFVERDLGSEYHPMAVSGTPLAPGPTKEFSFFLDEGATGPLAQPSGSTGCKAHISYRIDRSLMTFDQF